MFLKTQAFYKHVRIVFGFLNQGDQVDDVNLLIGKLHFLVHSYQAPVFSIGTGGQEISYKQKKLGSIELDVDMCPGTFRGMSWQRGIIMNHFVSVYLKSR